MKNTNVVVIKEQTFGSNTFEDTCFCQLKNTYNSVFTATNSAECIGAPNMHCLIFSIEGSGAVVYKNQSKVQLTQNSVFFGSMKDMTLIKSTCPRWHFICYWYLIENSEQEYKGVFTDERIDFEKEIKDANELINLMQSGSFTKLSIASSIFTIKLLSLANLLKLNQENSHKLLDKIITFVNAHIKEKLSTKDIAKEFGYCEKHIRYIFNRQFKTSPSKFIDSLKLEQIILMLQTTSYSLEDLAELYNYSSASHLINNFKKKFGLTPKQYIKRVKIRQEYAEANGGKE